MIFSIFTEVSGQKAGQSQAGVLMGACQIDITPGLPIPMSGYEARKTPFTGVHDKLYASALFFTDGSESLLLITADLIGYSRQFVEETQKLIAEKTGIALENIMITAAHNHGGPVTMAYEREVLKEVEEYVKDLQKKFIDLAVRASEKPIHFRMGTGSGSCDMNINRRADFADGSVWLGRAPGKPCDHEVQVARFEDLDGKILAVYINWPCHATTTGQDNYQITADWPGGAARYIKKQLGEETVVSVTAGASGDINPIYGPGKDFREIEAMGFLAGKSAYEALAEVKTKPASTLGAVYASLTFPGKKVSKDHFPQTTYESGPDVKLHLTVFRIGHLILTGISGELMNEIGSAIKTASPYSVTSVITHCNGSSGYICTDKAFPEGGYEVKVTRLMPGAEKPLTEKVLEMINSL